THTKCTIIVIDPAKSQSRSLTVASRHVDNLKYYVLGVLTALCVMALSVTVLYHTTQEQRQEKHQLTSLITDLQSKIPKQTDTLTAQDYVKRLDAKLLSISKYLKERGVKGFTHDAIGGDTIKPALGPLEYYSLYDQHLERLFEGLTYTPTGFPAKPELTSAYGYRANPFHSGGSEFHSGIDFRGKKDDLVRSTANGRVVHAGRNGGYGIGVQIKHKNGYETWYVHLSKCLVKKGDYVEAGQIVGEIGSTGRSTGSHLHYEVRKNNRPVTPIEFLKID